MKVPSAAKRGVFITLEGPEGAGKSTQAAALEKLLQRLGYETVLTREPGGTPLAEEIRGIVKHFQGGEPLYGETELLLFAAARCQHVKYCIRPAVTAGKAVICDRFYDSTEAYQGAGRDLDERTVLALRDFVCGDCHPDLTILLDLPPEVGLARASDRAARQTAAKFDRLEEEKLDFHRRVRERFLAIARREPERVKVVDGTQPCAAITAGIERIVRDALC